MTKASYMALSLEPQDMNSDQFHFIVIYHTHFTFVE